MDAQGSTYVVGDTISTDFLGYNGQVNGSNEVIFLKILPDGSNIAYGTILGGSSTDKGMAVAVNSSGEAYVTVDAGLGRFSIIEPAFPDPKRVNQGALLKAPRDRRLGFQHLASIQCEQQLCPGRNVALDSQGNVVIAGELYTALHTARDLAVLKINPQGTQALIDKRWTDDSVSETPTAVAVGPMMQSTSRAPYSTGLAFFL